MAEHLPESMIGQEVSAWCNKCKRFTTHLVYRTAVGAHASKPGPCLEHESQWLTQHQIKTREERRRRQEQREFFP